MPRHADGARGAASERPRAPLTVLFVTDETGVTGATVVLMRLADALDRSKVTPVFLTPDDNTQLIGHLQARAIAFRTTTAFGTLESAHALASGAGARKVLARAALVRRLTPDLAACLEAHDVDVMHANNYPLALYCAPAAVATRTPYLFHDHNLRPISARNWLNYRAVGLFASRAVVVSEACRRHLERAIPAAKLQVIRNGIDLGEASTEPSPALRRQLAGSEHAPLVALIGQPREEKGTHVLLEAAPEIVARHPDARILIVGYLFQDEYQRRLDELVRSHGLERHVIFTGWRNDVPAIVANVDVLAHCRVTPEPAALVLIEAMAAARPVVVSDTGGSGEIVIDGVTGRLYPPGDAKALARAVIELLDDPVRAAAMGRAGRTRVEQHFTLAAQARAFEQVYAELSTGAAA